MSKKKNSVTKPIEENITEAIEETVEEVIEEPIEETVEEIVTEEKETDYSVYIGPTIIGVVQKGTIFECCKEDAIQMLKSAIDKYPGIALMIVSGKELALKQKEIKTKGNLLYVEYNKLIKK